MMTYKFTELSDELLRKLVRLQVTPLIPEKWDQMRMSLTEYERQQIEAINRTLRNKQVTRMNEATIWARAIYPLLVLAEQPGLQAWSEVAISAQYPSFSLEGIVDGVIAKEELGAIRSPYLIITETKRGVEAKDPTYQMLGEMLAAAWINYRNDHQPQQLIYGCYTIADTWTFAEGVVEEFEAEHPLFTVELSSEYKEIKEAETIFQILKSIVAKFTNNQ
jgi:hypothetical protein